MGIFRERWVFFHASDGYFSTRAMGIFPRERWVFFHASGDARTVGFPTIFVDFCSGLGYSFPRAGTLALCNFRRFLPILIRERWVFFHASGDARTVQFPAIFANFDPRAMGIFPRERGRSHCGISSDFCQF
ncbi:MAG: hypothetical protein EAZ94_27185 [Oscillatoriales cyanobacterium]|nr:MAG: hypothetical protein EAZ94_27185 [Oscillatoriales cyanobacterium]